MCVRIYVYICVCMHIYNLFIVALGGSSKSKDKKEHIGTSLVAQWLRLQAPNAGIRVRSLVQELDSACSNKRSHTVQQRPGIAK